MMAVTHEDAEASPAVDVVHNATRGIRVHGERIDSRELFASGREILIAHGDETYRLRLTSQNKLILTK